MENLDPPPRPPPQIKDGKMAPFCPSRGFILDLGGWGFAVPFYFVQDCSLLRRLSFSLRTAHVFQVEATTGNTSAVRRLTFFGSLINFLPLKRRGALIRVRELTWEGGLNRGFTVIWDTDNTRLQHSILSSKLWCVKIFTEQVKSFLAL